jgi:hypothetical protein
LAQATSDERHHRQRRPALGGDAELDHPVERLLAPDHGDLAQALAYRHALRLLAQAPLQLLALAGEELLFEGLLSVAQDPGITGHGSPLGA